MVISDRRRWPLGVRFAFRERCATAAAYIAADRVSRDLPSFIATLVFFVQVFAAFWKTLENLGNSYDDSNPASTGLNRAPHNIAFGALYFWLPFAVLATAHVGGAQTENSVPRILERLRLDTREVFAEGSRESSPAPGNRAPAQGSALSHGPNAAVVDDLSANNSQTNMLSSDFPMIEYNMYQRWTQGGLPTWQPDKFEDWSKEPKFLIFSIFFSITIVAIPATAAMWVSWRTPTEGFGCRATAQASFFASLVVNHFLDWILCFWFSQHDSEHKSIPWRRHFIFWTTFTKDLLLTVGATVTLTYSAIGVFNNCDCWSKWLPDYRQRYISFPQEQIVFDDIKRRLSGEFAAVIAGALLIELMIFGIVKLVFRSGHRVLKQRDIDSLLARDTWKTKMKEKLKKPFIRNGPVTRTSASQPQEEEPSAGHSGARRISTTLVESQSPQQTPRSWMWWKRGAAGSNLRRRETFVGDQTGYQMTGALNYADESPQARRDS